jgi:hypothetical protein
MNLELVDVPALREDGLAEQLLHRNIWRASDMNIMEYSIFIGMKIDHISLYTCRYISIFTQ